MRIGVASPTVFGGNAEWIYTNKTYSWRSLGLGMVVMVKFDEACRLDLGPRDDTTRST